MRVSAARPDTHHDGCTIAADPSDERRLFAASMHWPTAVNSGVIGYFSMDGGATWEVGCERLGRAPAERCCDEAVTFSPDGGLYLAHMRGTPEAWADARQWNTLRTEFLFSADGGRTWEERGAVPTMADRPQLAVDCTTRPSRGRLYCNANDNRPLFYASSDGARTFWKARLPDPRLATPYPSNPVVLPDGTVVIAYRKSGVNATEPPTIPVWRSRDGGATVEAAPPVPTAWRRPGATSNNAVWVVYPVLAADPGPGRFAGRLYCAWVDGPQRDRRYVLFSSSSDAGSTWTSPACLSEQPLGEPGAEYQAEIPSVAVNRAGVVAVSWYDRRGLPKAGRGAGGMIRSEGYNVRLRVSTDGGKSWLPSVRLNTAPGKGDLIDVRYWSGLAADAAGRFHPVWVSDATGTRQLWTATVDVVTGQ